jgi:hypothetical protein
LLLGLKPLELITILNPGSAGPQLGETWTIGAPITELAQKIKLPIAVNATKHRTDKIFIYITL